MANNVAIPYYEDGDEITGYCLADVIGKRFAKIGDDRQPGGPSGVSDATGGGNVSVEQATSGDKVFGVFGYDQSATFLVPVFRYNRVMPVTAGAAISAGQEVQSDGAGKAIPLASGKPAGLAIADAASGADAQIALYP